MTLSERTLTKLRDESSSVGGKFYDDDEDALEADLTHFDEDDDPLTLIGDPVDDDDNAPVGEVPDDDEEDED